MKGISTGYNIAGATLDCFRRTSCTAVSARAEFEWISRKSRSRPQDSPVSPLQHRYGRLRGHGTCNAQSIEDRSVVRRI